MRIKSWLANSKWKRWALVIGLIAVLGVVVWQALALYRLWKAAKAVQADMNAIKALSAGGLDGPAIEQAAALFERTRADLEELDAAARPYRWAAPLLGWLPGYGADIKAAPALLDVARDLVRAVDPLLDAVLPLLDEALAQDDPDILALLPRVRETVLAVQPNLEAMLAAAQRAQAARATIDAAALSPRVQGWLAQLDRVLPLIEPGARLGLALPALLDDADALLALQSQDAFELERAIALAHKLRADIDALDAALQPFKPYLDKLPAHRADVEAGLILFQTGLDLAREADDLLLALEPALVPPNDGQPSLPQLALAIDAQRARFAALQQAVVRARQDLGKIERDALAPALGDILAQADRYLPMLEMGAQGMQILPELLGVDGARTWLILIQNQDELRASGGFISSVARLTVENAQLTALAFEDSYAIDDYRYPYPDPPAPLLDYMMSEVWVLRDGNWSPDFPTSARNVISLYTISRDFPIDGVIALDQQAIRGLIDAVSPLRVPGIAEPLNGENVIEIARYAYNPEERVADGKIDRDWWQHRKDIVGLALNAAVQRLQSDLDPAVLVRLAQAAQQSLEQKHLLVYWTEPNTAALLSDLGWDGALKPAPGDTLMVIDSNLGFNKANGLVEQALDYVVDLRDLDRPRAVLTVRHTHLAPLSSDPCLHKPYYDPTYEEMIDRCYWNYMRIYVPLGSELLDATPHAVSGADLLSGQPSPAEVWTELPEGGRTVWATFFLLRRGETLETWFDYALPASVIQKGKGEVDYTLSILKQPGTAAAPVRVQIILPGDMRVSSSEPAMADKDGRLTVSLDLRTDQTIHIRLEPNAR